MGFSAFRVLSLKGSVFPMTVPVALLSSFMCFAYMYWGVADRYVSGGTLMYHPNAYQFFLMIVALLVAFHANSAYGRYWQGRTNLQSMVSSWSQAVSTVMCFETSSGSPSPTATGPTSPESGGEQKVMPQIAKISLGIANPKAPVLPTAVAERKKKKPFTAFKCQCLHLVSTLHAVSMLYLLGHDKRSRRTKRKPPPIQILGGLSEAEATALKASSDQALQVSHWLSYLVNTFRDENGNPLPAPMATRFFNLLTAGFTAFDQACKIEETPFPLPHYQVMFVLDLCVIFVTPIVVSCWVFSIALAVVLTFMLVFTFHSIFSTAHIMENPFGYRQNDLPLLEIHDQFIDRLRCLVDDAMALTFNEMVQKASHPKGLPFGWLAPSPGAEVSDDEDDYSSHAAAE